MAKLQLVHDMHAVDQHKFMRTKFNELADVIGTEKAPEGCADEMMNILDCYSKQFKCSMASAYSRIKFNILNLVNL